MKSYWDSVPVGTWTITDSDDALTCLLDIESRAEFDNVHERINVFGPAKKAIIIDLKSIIENLGKKESKNFLTLIDTLYEK